MKNRTQSEPRAVNRVEVPQELADLLFERLLLPKLVDEFLDEEIGETLDTGDTMKRDVFPGGVL